MVLSSKNQGLKTYGVVEVMENKLASEWHLKASHYMGKPLVICSYISCANQKMLIYRLYNIRFNYMVVLHSKMQHHMT